MRQAHTSQTSQIVHMHADVHGEGIDVVFHGRVPPALFSVLFTIRRALAQSVSDHWPLERDNQKENICNNLSFSVSAFINTKNPKWTQKEPIPEESSEIDSEMSSRCCFLLRQLFLVQKTAHVRGAVREPQAMVIGVSLSQWGHPFFEHFVEAHFSLKTRSLDEICFQHLPNMRSCGSYFLENVRT